MKPEAKIRTKILSYLNSIGPEVFAWRVEQRPGMTAGHSDILMVYRGKLIALEVKTPGNHPTALQTRFLNKITLAGGVGAVVHSVDEVEILIGKKV